MRLMFPNIIQRIYVGRGWQSSASRVKEKMNEKLKGKREIMAKFSEAPFWSLKKSFSIIDLKTKQKNQL